MAENVTAVILAAGLGVRMKSTKPKVLHAAAGRPMIDHVVTQLKNAGISQIRLVVGHGAKEITGHLEGSQGLKFFTQREQRGTANAVAAADIASLNGTVIIGNGDHPLITEDDYKTALLSFKESGADILVVSAVVRKPFGFGRIVRQASAFEIIEEKEASEGQKKICEINSGLYIVKAEILKKLIPQVKNENSKKEFYLTDIVKLGFKNHNKTVIHRSPFARVCRGVNNLTELAEASRALYARKAKALLESGVVITDPCSTYIESEVLVEPETVIQTGVHLRGLTKIGKNCVIEPYCQVTNGVLGDQVILRWGSLVESSQIKDLAVVGPYARLRPESVVGVESHVGNFVELKKTVLGARSKANHLTYLGDAEIGEDTNIGCGTITCNYAIDRKKYKTKIGSRVFVGSDTQFVAPVNVGDGAAIASGSTITEDVPEDALAIARAQQVVKPNYMKKE